MVKTNPEWYNFQESIKRYFLTLGCVANTNVSLQGVRATHAIDVLVTSKFFGHEIKWIIEAKKWKSKVSKLHVLALRQIVEDTGVDKGFVISGMGFQKGAKEAVKTSNISLLTYDELQKYTNNIFHFEILNGYLKRLNLLFCRYYSHSKEMRIKYGLRQESGGYSRDFNVYFILIAIIRAIKLGRDNKYPIPFDTYLTEKYGKQEADNFFQLINWLNLNFSVVEEKLFQAEVEMQQQGEFRPNLYFIKSEDNAHMKIVDTIK